MPISLKLACGSIIIGIVVLGLKFSAYQLTGSIALYSDAMESIVNIATAFASFIAVHLSEKPADDNHPYGHHKVEYFSAVLVGVLIILAALAIFQEAYHHLKSPSALDNPTYGLLVNTGASVLNGLWCFVLLRQGRALRSPALIADGKHLLTDVISSLGIFVGIILALLTGWHILDPILALLVAAHILWSGWKLVQESINGLMDHAAIPEIINETINIICTQGKGAIQAHDLRTRQAGKATFIEFHLVVPGSMSVNHSHEICDRIERSLKNNIPGAKIIIHVEPEYKAKAKDTILISS